MRRRSATRSDLSMCRYSLRLILRRIQFAKPWRTESSCPRRWRRSDAWISTSRVGAENRGRLLARAESVPLSSVFRPIRALYTNDAETLSRRRAHDYPALLAFVHLGTQFFEPCNFRRNIVGLDIDVHAAFVVHALNLHTEFVGRRIQHAVIAPASRMLHIDRTTQRRRPKLRGGVDIIGLAIDQQPIDARAMHAVHIRMCGRAANR